MIIAVIQARMGSTRLPGKILKNLSGKPMLWHVVNRVKQVKKIDRVIVATTTEGEDDVIEELSKKEGWDYSRGSAEDVLSRYYNTAKKYNSSGDDIIVRVPGDCPLVDPEIIDGCIDVFQNGTYDFLCNTLKDSESALRGIDDVEVFSFATLEKAYKNAKEKHEKEHVTPYIWENTKNEFKVAEARIKVQPEWKYRLTVDYEEDFQLIEKIYEELYKPETYIKTGDVISYLDQNPMVVHINAHCEQKKLK